MPGFLNVAQYAAADAAGASHLLAAQGAQPDQRVGQLARPEHTPPATRKPQYYASARSRSPCSTASTVFHGDAKSPGTKHLAALGLMTPTAALVARYQLLDYLLYYPFVDGDSLDEQPLDNT